MHHKNENIYQLLFNIIMTGITVLTLLPFVVLLSSSFSLNTDITLYGYSMWPRTFSMEGYGYIWNERIQILHAYCITVGVTAAGTFAGIVISVLYAYALSKPVFPLKRFFTLFVLFTMLFNGGLVPTYIMYTRYLHLKNTVFALLIPGLLMNAFNVILVRSYIQNNIPKALFEAATIDGASEAVIIRKIVFPVAKPIIATVGLFIGVAYWNDWMNGLYYITDSELYSIQQILNNMLRNIEYLSRNASSAVKSNALAGVMPASTVRMSIAVVGILPILAIYPFVQKYFVKGISLGAVKG